MVTFHSFKEKPNRAAEYKAVLTKMGLPPRANQSLFVSTAIANQSVFWDAVMPNARKYFKKAVIGSHGLFVFLFSFVLKYLRNNKLPFETEEKNELRHFAFSMQVSAHSVSLTCSRTVKKADPNAKKPTPATMNMHGKYGIGWDPGKVNPAFLFTRNSPVEGQTTFANSTPKPGLWAKKNAKRRIREKQQADGTYMFVPLSPSLIFHF